jgi:NTE family protein
MSRLHTPRVHMISAEEEFRALKGGSRQNPNRSFLLHIRGLGRRAAAAWLSEGHVSVGGRSTVDLSLIPAPA